MIINKKLLITGCGRSGTTFASELFKQLGIHIGHEKIDHDGISSWKEAVKPKWKLHLQYNYIFHQVRNPVDSMNSFQTISPISWEFIGNYIPLKESDSNIIKYAKYWYYWNKMIEKKTHIRYKVESIFEDLPSLCEMLHVRYAGALKSMVSNKINTRKYSYIPESELFLQIKAENEKLYDLLLNSIQNYGYPLL